jgi:hypothetical protein
MVMTRPSRSLDFKAASSPLRAPESAAKRTSRRTCSALWRAFTELSEPSHEAPVFSTNTCDCWMSA